MLAKHRIKIVVTISIVVLVFWMFSDPPLPATPEATAEDYVESFFNNDLDRILNYVPEHMVMRYGEDMVLSKLSSKYARLVTLGKVENIQISSSESNEDGTVYVSGQVFFNTGKELTFRGTAEPKGGGGWCFSNPLF